MGALIVVICAAIWLYLPRKVEREAVALMSSKAETLAQLTAFTIHPALFFQDRAALDEALSGTKRDRDVAYIIVTDADGNRLTAFQPERVGEPLVHEVTAPIRDGQRQLATLRIGMSLRRVSRDIRDMRVAIGAMTALILAAGLVAVVLISNLLTRPLRGVAAAARHFAAGDLSHRVHAGSGEVGELAMAFNHMAASLADRDAALRDLSKRLLSVQEQERVRIAREVHDELGQALTALKIDLGQIGARDVGAKIDGIVDLVRRIATDLRPAILDDLGITAALEQQLRRVRESTGIATTLRVSEEPELDMLTSVTLYRIAQEALSNVIRHAEAKSIDLSLTIVEGSAVLEIRDDGRGFSPNAAMKSLGLVGIRERAELLRGTAAIESKPGEGTTVRVRLPLNVVVGTAVAQQ
jgi:signal transduction histidine kinase